MQPFVDVNGLKQLSAELEKTRVSSLPNVVRSTLNDLAFDVKKNTLIPSIQQSGMTLRNPSFFKKYSGVEKAIGWNILEMKATVGMIPSGNAEKAVNRLKAQDEGGNLDERNFIADENARVGRQRSGRVQKNRYRSSLKLWGHIQAGDKQGLIRTVTASHIESGGSGKGNVLIYGNTVFEIQGFKRLRKQNSIKIHLKKIYTYKKGRTVNVKAHKFTQIASNISAPKANVFFQKNAEKQLQRLMKK